MLAVNVLYATRIQEINEYFKYLHVFDNTSCTIDYIDDHTGDRVHTNITPDFYKILKANGYLLLYNVIEAVVEKSLDAVFTAINNENLTFQRSSSKIQNLCIKLHSSVIKDRYASTNTIENQIRSVIDYFVGTALVSLKKRLLTNRSGNLDSQKIRDISQELGINHIATCPPMRDIKTKRNNLAHGDISFADEGRNITYEDLENYKDEIISYLRVFIDDVTLFIINKEYM